MASASDSELFFPKEPLIICTVCVTGRPRLWLQRIDIRLGEQTKFRYANQRFAASLIRPSRGLTVQRLAHLMNKLSDSHKSENRRFGSLLIISGSSCRVYLPKKNQSACRVTQAQKSPPSEAAACDDYSIKLNCKPKCNFQCHLVKVALCLTSCTLFRLHQTLKVLFIIAFNLSLMCICIYT